MKRYIKASKELWDSARVFDLVNYYLDRSNVSDNVLAHLVLKQMKEEGSKLPYNTCDFYDVLYSAIYEYNEQYSDDDVYSSTSIVAETTNEVVYSNGAPVSDIDLAEALDYMYGTDRDPDIGTYTHDEKQRAVNYWMSMVDSPEPKVQESVARTYIAKVGGVPRVHELINEICDEYPGMDSDITELAKMLLISDDSLSKDEWECVIEYVQR